MPKWTNEQLDAINKDGTNIIVSAGAGSGKTAVLTERVITKLKKGIKINELLILTFTNAAALEMKERIRKKISEVEELKDNLDYLDSAYITTFDSYTLSLVKKYNYLLNVSPNISIVDNSIISLYKSKLLDKIFDDLYLENDYLFNKFINDFAIKNDTNIKDSILKLISNIELISDKDDFFDKYFDKFLNDKKINEYVEEFDYLLLQEIKNIETNLFYLSELSYGDYYEKMVNSLNKLLKARTYDEIKLNIDLSLPRRPRNSEDIIPYKDRIDESIKILKGYLRFKDTKEIIETLNISKDYIKIIIKIIKKFYEEINKYKFDNDLYEFTDIELLAIKLLKEYDYIRKEVKDYYKEILIDEYQDTNDLQEEFISLIANNNIYMVGDIKQSIYGFRNANPSIFKNKYDEYSLNNNGIKIDLLKNFRSRNEVVTIINEMFSKIMDDLIGGCDYKNSHQMIFGNNLYNENKGNNNYDLEIFNYDLQDKNYSKEEVEAFIIATDIKIRINNNYQVIDKNTNSLRNCTYEDFCIIMDRNSAFPIYKKVFEYLKIPLSIYEDKKLTNEIDIKLISNIVELILKIKDNIIDIDFKYDFVSILRSYLFNYNDNFIFEIFKNNKYSETELYEICLNIAKDLDTLNSYLLLNRIINDFNFYEKTILVGNINDTIIRVDNLKNLARNLSEIGYSITDFNEYLKVMINSKNEITYKGSNININAVKIMNIHKSKGLEFPICYYSGLYKEFNTMDIKTRFVFDNKYGFITPFFKEGIGSTILKDLLKNKYTINDISEKIRLLYVALTRCREKMIIVASLDDNKNYQSNLVDYNIRSKYKSFLSIFNSLNGNLNKYIYNINIENIGLTKDYLNTKMIVNNITYKSDKKIVFNNVNYEQKILINKHASKEINELLTNEDIKKIEYGTYMHELLEETDFSNIPHNEYYEVINNLKEQLNINNNTKIYKEYEFVLEEDNVTYHGIIDLVLIEDDIIKIVDYKLKNIDDSKYIDQLKIYYKYLKNIFEKDIKVYLYSIVDNKLKEIIVNNSNL